MALLTRPRRSSLRWWVPALLLVVGAAACAASEGAGDPRTLAVPSQYGTVQDAVDAARPGDLVLVSPGVYREAVLVVTPEVTIRGTDRNTVVLDGRGGLETGVSVVDTGGVAVENLTVRNYSNSGLTWIDAAGFRASHVTAYDNGRVGIDVFDSVDGLVEQVWASGSGEVGLRITQCDPCQIVVDGLTAVDNGTGVLLTNAGRELQVVRSTVRSNRAGIVLHSTGFSLCGPQQGATVAGNLVGPNDRRDLLIGEVGIVADNSGIAVVGGRDNDVRSNRVTGQPAFGIVVAPYPELEAAAPLPEESEVVEPCRTRAFLPSSGRIAVTTWPATGNRLTANVVVGSGVADLAVGAVADEASASGNCASGNLAAVTRPTDLQALAPCGSAPTATDWGDGAYVVPDLERRERKQLLRVGDDVEPRRGPVPPPQPQLPGAATAPVVPATTPPVPVDVDTLVTPG